MSEDEIEEMFAYADKDGDGKISYQEFQAMINPPKPPPATEKSRKSLVKKVTIQANEPGPSAVINHHHLYGKNCKMCKL